MMKIAIMGFGTVGKGTLINLQKYSSLCQVIKIFDLPKKREEIGNLFEEDFHKIINNTEIDLIVEVLGGHDLAYQIIQEALNNKKHVVTANKEVMACHFNELINLARINEVALLFEASVGSEIPIIKALGINGIDGVTKINAILNGTTNYILTKMTKEHLSYEEALKKAQEEGFAERDPQADIDGLDMIRKISILSMLAYNGEIDINQVHHHSLRGINQKVIESLNKKNYCIKYIATSSINDDVVTLSVEPVIIKKNNPLALIDYENNTIIIEDEVHRTYQFSGHGAGMIPTGLAITNDILAIIKNNYHLFFNNQHKLQYNKEEKLSSYLVIGSIDQELISKEENEYIITKLINEQSLQNSNVKFYARIKEE